MKQDSVPQDNADTYDGHTRLVYATDDKGDYSGIQTNGWEVEEYATTTAINELHRLAADAYQRAQQKLSSPLEFHMYNKRMDIALLSQTSGFFQWRIKRHFQAARFAKLKPALLKRYADALGLPMMELKSLPDSFK